MRHWYLWIAFAACGGGSRPSPTPPVVANTPLAAPSCTATADHVRALVSKDPKDDESRSQRMRDAIETRCTTDAWAPDARTCIAGTQSLADPQHCKEKLTSEQREALEVALAALDHEPETAAGYDSKQIPVECQDFMRALHSFESCDKVPQASRDYVKQSDEELSGIFRNFQQLSPNAKTALVVRCKQGAASMVQAAAGMGC